MKAKAYRKKYDVLHITKNTTVHELVEFTNEPDAVKVIVHGIGFCAEQTLCIKYKDGSIDKLYPGTVIIKDKDNFSTCMSESAYALIFHEEDK